MPRKKPALSLSTLLTYPDTMLSEDALLIKNYFIKLIRCMPNNVYWLDKNCVTLGCNDNVLKLVGLDKLEDFVGITYQKMAEIAQWESELAQSFYKDDMEVIKTGLPKLNVEEAPLYDHDGNLLYYLSNRFPLFDDEHNIVGVVGTSVDITSHKEAESLRLQNAVNEEKMETMRLMAASMAHEIRTPLATLNAQSGIIEMMLPTILEAYHHALAAGQVTNPLKPAYLDFLTHLPEELNKTTASANTFIDMLLAKVNFEHLKEENRPLITLNSQTAMENALSLYPLDEVSSAMLECNEQNSFAFKGDETLFRHVLFNLLKNAIFFVRSKREGGKIQVWFEQQDTQNIFHFKDTGIGIKAEILPHIFNSFYTKRHHGTGVGLAFCKMIVESFGGTISCESVEGEYTHFMLTFPKI